MAHLDLGPISTQCRSQYDSHPHLCLVPYPPKPLDLHVTSIPVVTQLNPESHIFVSSQSSLWLTTMQIPGNASQSHPGPISQGHLHMKMYVSPPYRSFLTSHSQYYCLPPSTPHPPPTSTPHPSHPPHQHS